VDMIASPNGIPHVINATSAPHSETVAPSTKIQKHLERGFKDIWEPWTLMNTSMMVSDEWSFLEVGVPIGALMNGASKRMTQSQREIFGGMAGASFDPCYHKGCDTFENVNVRLLKVMSQVGFRTVMYLAQKEDLKAWLWDGQSD